MSNDQINIRTYQKSDAEAIASIYYNTIHNINTRDYSKEQINAWAPYASVEDYSGWQKKLEKVKPFVATINETIVGFAEFEPNGHIDCFYVHHEYQGKGVGTALIQAVFDAAKKQSIRRIYAEVSITARPFFTAQGFNVVKAQTVTLRGVELNNFVMEKTIARAYPYISTKNCILRLPEPEESQLICDFAIQNKAYLQQWEPLQPDNYYKNDYWKDKITQLHEDFVHDKSCCMSIYLQENQQLIGMVNYSNFVRGAFQSCFLGFKIDEEMQDKGLMTEVLQAFISYVFETLNLHRIAANYMPHNIASAKVLEKCGFQQEGLAEDYLFINGKWKKHVLTSLINHEWKNNR